MSKYNFKLRLLIHKRIQNKKVYLFVFHILEKTKHYPCPHFTHPVSSSINSCKPQNVEFVVPSVMWYVVVVTL